MTDLESDTVRDVERLITDWMHEEDVPGASLVVVDADGELYAEGFGARDLASNAPATPDTLYGMASITKSVTATAIGQLVEDGELSVEDPIDDYLDHFADAPGEPITIRALLSHTSGMPATSPGVLGQAFTGYPSGVADEADRERFVRESTDWRDVDGDRFMYYNTGYDLLGRVVELVDGRSYPEYVREELLDPLGMERSGFRREAIVDDDEWMTGYEPGDDEEPPEPVDFPFEELIYPAGGLVSSPRELSRFVRAAMTDGTLDGERVCPRGWLDRCQEPRAIRQTYLDGTEERYGFGWMRQSVAGDEAVGHGGSIVASTSYAGFLAEAELGVVLACNTTAEPHPMDIGLGVLALVAGSEPTAVPALAVREKCRAVAGEYEGFRGDPTATVEPDGGTVSVELTGPFGTRTFHAFPETLDTGEHAFYTVTEAGARTPVEFDLGGERADLFFQRNRLRRTEPGE